MSFAPVAAVLAIGLAAAAVGIAQSKGPLQPSSATTVQVPMTGSDVWTWGVDLPVNDTSSDIIVKSVELIDPEGLVVIGMTMTNPSINGGVVAVRGFPPPGLVAFPVEGAVMTPRVGGSSELEVLVGLALSGEGTAGSVGGIRVRYTAGGRDFEVALPYTLQSIEPGP